MSENSASRTPKKVHVKTLVDNGFEDPTPEEGEMKIDGDTLIINEADLMFPLVLKRVVRK